MLPEQISYIAHFFCSTTWLTNHVGLPLPLAFILLLSFFSFISRRSKGPLAASAYLSQLLSNLYPIYMTSNYFLWNCAQFCNFCLKFNIGILEPYLSIFLDTCTKSSNSRKLILWKEKFSQCEANTSSSKTIVPRR